MRCHQLAGVRQREGCHWLLLLPLCRPSSALPWISEERGGESESRGRRMRHSESRNLRTSAIPHMEHT